MAQAPELAEATRLVVKRDFVSARRLLQTILKANPAEPEALNLTGVILVEEGRLEEAAASFERALKANPKLGGAYINLGYLYKRQQKPESALAAFQKAAAVIPGDVEAIFNTGVLLADLQRFKEAADTLSAVPVEKRSANFWETLARICLTDGD